MTREPLKLAAQHRISGPTVFQLPFRTSAPASHGMAAGCNMQVREVSGLYFYQQSFTIAAFPAFRHLDCLDAYPNPRALSSFSSGVADAIGLTFPGLPELPANSSTGPPDRPSPRSLAPVHLTRLRNTPRTAPGTPEIAARGGAQSKRKRCAAKMLATARHSLRLTPRHAKARGNLRKLSVSQVSVRAPGLLKLAACPGATWPAGVSCSQHSQLASKSAIDLEG